MGASAKAVARRRNGRGAYRSDSMIVMDEDGSLNAKATADRVKNDPLYKNVKAKYNQFVAGLSKVSAALTEVQSVFTSMGFQNESTNDSKQLERDMNDMLTAISEAGGRWKDPNFAEIANVYSGFNRIRSDLHGPIQWSRWAKENIDKMKDAFKPIA